jgi:hypothetical protein
MVLQENAFHPKAVAAGREFRVQDGAMIDPVDAPSKQGGQLVHVTLVVDVDGTFNVLR